MTLIRKTSQHLMPVEHPGAPDQQYDIYPHHDLGPKKIGRGFAALAQRLAQERAVCLDGYVGILWEDLRAALDQELRAMGVSAQWIDVSGAFLPEPQIELLVAPFLGGDDPLFGTRFTGELIDFFDRDKLRALNREGGALQIYYGCGAALADESAAVYYVDIPKNEIQFRSRAGAVRNLGMSHAIPAKRQYKRFYFVDWVALSRHKCALLPRISVVVDGQRADDPLFAEGDEVRAALETMARTYFRVRPWFEPGPWGGQWIRGKVPGLAPDVPNYAWSFELIVPENGLVFSSDGLLLEVSFDFLMFQNHRAVLGDCADRFEYEFPIRFDFLDTFEGGYLSLQCHPRPEYIRENFGETFTQDETYYILDCEPGAEVYLGFREGVDADAFRADLERSFREAQPIDVRKYINVETASKHDLFLIPNGTVHCSGTNNMVLEISATPYIFTFKMYDWMRLDLDGNPRPLNIDRAFENLYFDRQGAAAKELVSKPRVIEAGDDWRLLHLPTHRDHFYDVHRFEFSGAVDAETNGSAHVLSLVEGRSVLLETAGGIRQRFYYAETFVVPAAAGRYRLVSESGEPVMVVKAFVKTS